jgi:tRNA (guanine-N7-)-methyltransferase
MRLRNKPWAEDEILAHPKLVIPNPQELKGKWHTFFNNSNPIHIEVGTGKGRFVSEMAKAHPEINYIGVELQTSVIVVALEKVKEANVPNLCLLRQNVEDLLLFFEPGELERVYINFTDPWPKKRHDKRRLTHGLFLKKYQFLVGEGGEVHLKTDNEGLFEFSLNSFADFGCRLKRITFNLHESDFEGNIMTEYEEKFSSKGMKIFRCEAILPKLTEPLPSESPGVGKNDNGGSTWRR